jgi:3-hydroxyacyl-CoA dehydrogenase / 3-hydroxy-2-methylbutyryl-CoA dehydrogenase
MKIDGCVALVTGGASGLGEACVRDIVDCGGKVAILDIDAEKGEKLAHEFGPNVLFTCADVTDEEGSRAAVLKTVETFGEVSVAVNCAGTIGPAKVYGKKGPMSLAAFNRVLQTNLVGTFNIIRLAVEQMVKNVANEEGERGVIINTASIAASDGQIGQAAYSASKAGVIGMTLPIARECGDYGIRVVTITPGVFDTPMMAGMSEDIRKALTGTLPFPKRFGKPPEFARLVRQIVENPMLNGDTIRLDGALRMAAK